MGSPEQNKKVAVTGVASIFLVACVVAATVSVGSSGGGEISTASKSVKEICAPTDYKETCERSLAGAKDTDDPKELIKVAFKVTVENITDAISKSELLKEADKDPRTSDALDTCKELLKNSIDDLERSFEKVENFDLERVKEYTNDLKVWLSGAITQQQTCIDAFENTTGDTGEKMKHLLKTANELSSNGLAMITHFTELLQSLEIPAGLNFKRRLLTAETKGEGEGEEEEFPGFVDAATRRLLTTNPASIKHDAVVAKDGSGQYKSVVEALKAVPYKNNETFVIFIKAGVYNERVEVPRKMNKIVFVGEGPTKTRITGSRSYKDGIGTYHTATVAIQGDGFIARNIGFENSAGAAKHQAVAIRVSADMTIFHNCHIDAYQDTLYTHAYRQYYRDCTITGTIDFIFGDAAAVFQNCKMVVRKPLEKQACMVTAQGRKEHRGVGGLVLQNCDIIPDPALKSVNPPVKVYLGRPWKEYSRTIIMQSYINGFIAPEGWSPWEGELGLDTLWYAEYQNRGSGASTASRVNWNGYKKNISPDIAQQFTVGIFLQGDEWIKPTGIPYDSGMTKV
ncbi:PREDICTED: pectinesterase-like [Ipomoea nil]|uniref:pectinesterase-like n=1 Tax=Ipomoea nil TaxID=35883 RepID=UPI000901247C|nr:PREDICTED: pectinesterase-like [Ipomoea nil]